MKTPNELDRVICPQGGMNSKDAPEEVWDGAKGPNGEPRRYGVLKPHRHGFTPEECEYSGHVVPVEREEKKETTRFNNEFWPPIPGLEGWGNYDFPTD